MIPRTTFPGKFVLVSAPSATQAGTTASGSAVVTLTDTGLIAGALSVTGTGIPLGAFVLSVDSATQITLTKNATATGSAALAFALEPVTLAQAKNHLRVEFADDDALIATLIQACRERLEGEIDRAFISTTYDYVLEQFPSYDVRNDPAMYRRVPAALEIPKGDLISVTSLKYVAADTTVVTLTQGTDYLVRTGAPGAVSPFPITGIWPYTRQQLDAVTLRCVFGYGATADSVPASVKAALLMLLGHLYANREATADARLVPLPMGAQYLLSGCSWGSRP